MKLNTSVEPAARAVAPSSVPDPAPMTAMPYLPALDGLRGLAVIGAILFHGGFTWARGGFLGVSTFFVLSGFLITNLLVREWDNGGTIRLGRFWIRRLRRLLPAALLALALVALLWWQLGTAEQLANLRWDLLAALAYVANWRFYFAGTSYAELFSAPSPLQHFWSLAIEEQFYLLFPPAVIALLHAGGRRLLATGVCAAITVSVLLEFGLGGDFDRIYYGTDTRAAELLIGALLALWWSNPSRLVPACRERAGKESARFLMVDIAGIAALAGMFWSWGAVTNTSAVLARGGLPAYALLTAVIIYAASRPGWVARCLSLRPLRWIGLISYGLYLYHWPVFLILDDHRLGWSAGPLFALRMAVTTLIAVTSFHLLEMPIRRGQVFKTDPAALRAALAGALVVATCAILVTLNPPQSIIPYADVRLEDFPTAMKTEPEQSVADPAPATDSGSIAQTVLILGDSGTVDASPALRAVFEAAGATKVIEAAYPGVGLSNPDLKWRAAYTSQINKHHPDLVIMMLGGWDLGYVEAQGASAYSSIVDEAVNILTADGAHLLWLSMLPGGTTPQHSVDRIYEQLPERFFGKVGYADIEASLRAAGDAHSSETMAGAELWPRSYVDTTGATVLLRKPDFWPLCPAGAQRLAIAINQAAAELGWAALAPTGWEQGSWRADARYDDPKGACVLK